MFYIQVFTTKKGGLCAVLKADLGYTTKVISFDTSLIAELAGISVRELLDGEKRINL